MEQNDILLSIIVPVYNVEKYITECLNSIICQLSQEIELIIINDGTEDKSYEIALSIGNGNKSIIFLEQSNLGLSATRNLGVEKAKGQYVFFIDSDDFIRLNAISYIKKALENSSDLFDILAIGYENYDFENKIDDSSEGDYSIVDYNKEEIYLLLKALRNPLSGAWRYIVRRDFLIENSIYFKEGMLCEDIEWCTKIFVNANIIRSLSVSLYMYRIDRVGSIMNVTSSKRIYHAFEGIVNAYDILLKENDCSEMLKRSLRRYLLQQIIYNWSFFNDILYDDSYTIQEIQAIINKSLNYQNQFLKTSFRLLGVNFNGSILHNIKKLKGCWYDSR